MMTSLVLDWLRASPAGTIKHAVVPGEPESVCGFRPAKGWMTYEQARSNLYRASRCYKCMQRTGFPKT